MESSPQCDITSAPKAGARILFMRYGPDLVEERQVSDIHDILSCAKDEAVAWIDVEAADPATVEAVGTAFGIHPLIQEDILTPVQRPKMEEQDDHLFLVLNAQFMENSGGKSDIREAQISLILGKNFVITFQSCRKGLFAHARDSIRSGRGRLRTAGADHLAYSLVDAVVDNYFVVLEELGERLEAQEDEVLASPSRDDLEDIYDTRRRLLYLRRAVWPLREVVNGLMRWDSPLVARATIPYLRDVYDHTVQIMDTIETDREIVAGMLEIYLSSVSMQLNQVMKVLTIISTIFIPLNFVAGIYGMNFRNMPELESPYGYYVVLGLMTCLGLGMLAWFRRAKWI